MDLNDDLDLRVRRFMLEKKIKIKSNAATILMDGGLRNEGF